MKRRHISESAIRYLSYQIMIENGLSLAERDRLVEVGLVDKVISWLGAGKDTAEQLGGAAMSLMKNNEFARRMVSAEKAIGKEIDDLKSLAKSAGQSEEAVYGILKQILNKAGAPSAQLENPPTPAKSSDGDEKSPDEIKSGTTLTSDNPQELQDVITTALSQATGQTREKVQNAVEDQGKDVSGLSTLLAKAAVSKGGVRNVDLAKKFIIWLIDNGQIKKESKIYYANILHRNHFNGRNAVLVERWVKLAGLSKNSVLQRSNSVFLPKHLIREYAKDFVTEVKLDLKKANSGDFLTLKNEFERKGIDIRNFDKNESDLKNAVFTLGEKGIENEPEELKGFLKHNKERILHAKSDSTSGENVPKELKRTQLDYQKLFDTAGKALGIKQDSDDFIDLIRTVHFLVDLETLEIKKEK